MFSVCSECAYGKYVVAPCLAAGSQDVQCAACSTCNNLQYVSRKCEYGLDTICDTCEVCEFTSSAMKKQCESGLWHSWSMEHCCTDAKGNKISCRARDEALALDTAISGRHHWAVEGGVTSPQVIDPTGKYKFGRAY